MDKSIIIALDYSSLEEVEAFLDLLGEEKLFVKVGMELFYSAGPSVIKAIKRRGHRIFLDLKLHDIPNTVHMAMKNLAGLDVDMVNVHAAGGKKMMQAALEGLEAGRLPGKKRPLLIAVTQLTSTTEDEMQMDQGIMMTLEESVIHYAGKTKEAGLDGVVCSPWEAEAIHKVCGDAFLAVTPGIRLAEGNHHDQNRVATPAKARELGSDLIVVGRSITSAGSPLEAYKEVTGNWESDMK